MSAADAVPLLTPEDVATLARCQPDTVRELAQRRVLRGVKLGRDWTFPATLLYEDLCKLANTAPRRRGASDDKGEPPAPSATIVPMREGRRGKRQPPALPQLPAAPQAQGGQP
jgi:excisionase family DNA binding protein